MVVSIVLDTEYMGVAERNKWFLKAVSNAISEDTLIVTHSYFKDHIEEVVEGCADRFYKEFEMEKVCVEIIEKLDICYIPDELFDSIYEKTKTRTKQILSLYNERQKRIEEYIIEHINNSLKMRGLSKPEFIINCLHTFASVKYLAEFYNCPIIPYVFSCVRKVHGYSQTLYMAHIDKELFNSNACKIMYEQQDKADLGFPVLNKAEILALLGKKHNMPLIPLLERKGIYEVGVIGEGFHITPEIYQNDPVTDDDLYYESRKLFGSKQIITRIHPMQLDQAGIGRSHMKNDPAAFLLSCNKVVTVQSQMIIKAAMWNRNAVAMSTALPYSCLLNKQLTDDSPVNDYNLNFILFVYFVPNSCMFSSDYWLWRMSNPSCSDIAQRHMKAICEELDIPKSVIFNGSDRLRNILRYRKIGQIECITNNVNIGDVSYDYPTSCLKCTKKDGNVITLYALNHKINDSLYTGFQIPIGIVKCDFIPQFDLDGFVSIQSLRLENRVVEINCDAAYYEKNQSVVTLEIDPEKSCRFNVNWTVRSYKS